MMGWMGRSQQSLARRAATLRDSHTIKETTMPHDFWGMKHMSAPIADTSGVQINPTGDFLHGEDCWREVSHHQCAITLIEWQWDVIAKTRREKDRAIAARREAGAQLTAWQMKTSEARTWARRLYAHNRELTHTLLTAVPHRQCPPPAGIDEALQERDVALATCTDLMLERNEAWAQLDEWPRVFGDMVRQRNAARDALAEITALLHPVVEDAADGPGVCRDCGAQMQTVRPGKVQCQDCGVCPECGRTTYKGKCPNGCDMDAAQNDHGGWSGILIGATCLDCGAQLSRDSKGEWQECQECHGAPLALPVCQRCGHVTHDGVCSGGCYPRDYSEQPS